MYSFAQRPDIVVVDEPLYGHYLRISGAPHPGRDEVLATMDTDGDRVIARLMRDAKAADRRLFVKQMAHHLVDIDTDFLEQVVNVFLIRDPRQMLPSLAVQLPEATLDDTGLKLQCELYDRLVESGQHPTVVDARELLTGPQSVLRQLCARLGLGFTDAMLAWPAGPRPEDGVWAPYWYHAVHESTGFGPYVEKKQFPDHLLPLLETCKPWYDRLVQHTLRAVAGE